MNVGGEVLGARAQNKAAAANKAEARKAMRQGISDTNLRQTQETMAASQQVQETQRSTMSAVASAQVSAAEGNVTGASVSALLNDIGAEGSNIAQTIVANKDMTLAQLERQKLGIYADADSRANAVPKANPFASALRIGGYALNTASQLQTRKAPSAGPARTTAAAVAPAVALPAAGPKVSITPSRPAAPGPMRLVTRPIPALPFRP